MRSFVLFLLLLTACGQETSSTSPGSTPTATDVAISIKRGNSGLPRLFASTGDRRHRASTGSFTLTHESRGDTGGGTAADGLPNTEIGSPDWDIEAGEVSFHLDAFRGVESAVMEVCLDPRCKRSIASTHLALSKETTWTVELREGIYVLDIWLRFDGGDAGYLWTFEAR